MKIYRTAEIAAIIGIHPNTVRLYEALELVPKPEREANGYRVYTDYHVEQFRLVRTAFQIEILQNGLRKKIVEVVKTSAKGDFDQALIFIKEYITQLKRESEGAEEAIKMAGDILSGHEPEQAVFMKRKEVSEYLHISMDTLRNWELNGLLQIKRKQNGYRIYTEDDIKLLKIIRSLRCGNYSLEAILRMLHQLSENPKTDIRAVLNTPNQTDDIISVCDRLIASLSEAERNANIMLQMLQDMKRKFKLPSI